MTALTEPLHPVNVKQNFCLEHRDPNLVLLLCLRIPLKSMQSCPPRGRPTAPGGKKWALGEQLSLAGRCASRPPSSASIPPHRLLRSRARANSNGGSGSWSRGGLSNHIPGSPKMLQPRPQPPGSGLAAAGFPGAGRCQPWNRPASVDGVWGGAQDKSTASGGL